MQIIDPEPPKEPEAPAPLAQMVITLVDQGKIAVNCTTPDKIIVLGMLEMAKAMILSPYFTQETQKKIAEARVFVPGMVIR